MILIITIIIIIIIIIIIAYQRLQKYVLLQTTRLCRVCKQSTDNSVCFSVTHMKHFNTLVTERTNLRSRSGCSYVRLTIVLSVHVLPVTVKDKTSLSLIFAIEQWCSHSPFNSPSKSSSSMASSKNANYEQLIKYVAVLFTYTLKGISKTKKTSNENIRRRGPYIFLHCLRLLLLLLLLFYYSVCFLNVNCKAYSALYRSLDK